MIKKKVASGVIPETNFDLIKETCKRINKSDISIDFLRTHAFYDPEKFIFLKNYMNDLLFYFSTAFSPYQFGWGSLFINKEKIIDGENIGPFEALCKEKLNNKIRNTNADMIMIFISSSDQVEAGKIMAKFIKLNFPEKTLVVIRNPHVDIDNDKCFDYCFSMDNLAPFFKLTQTLFKTTGDTDNIFPDFKSLPLNDYLAPDTVLPANLSFFKDKKSFMTFLSNQQANIDVKGFALEGDHPEIKNLLKNIDESLFFSTSKSMDDKDISDSSRNQQAPFPSNLKMVCWDSPKKRTPFKSKILWELSKQGVWNHVKISQKTESKLKNDLFSFIASNPNIAHSFENRDAKNNFNESDKTWIDSKFQSYSHVEQLPGKPFWKTLEDPIYQLLYLNKTNKKDLFCMRSDQKKPSLIKLGSNIQFYFKKADDLPDGFLDEICKMVEAGGSVDIKYVRYNLERAYLIGYAMENGVIVGNSSLKHPRQEFIERIKKTTRLDFTHFVERGYTSVRPEYRALGVGARLLEGLTKRAGNYKIFSIISEDNLATQKIAKRNKTKKIVTYFSEKVGKELGVWMPEKMIEDDWNLKK
ncbi:MAG: GNAT family N-acetyltransferase [Desulfobacteraceae bacterium]|nr:GNAT family N-acetyltransferase [Desulfobacteraceae bacterium]